MREGETHGEDGSDLVLLKHLCHIHGVRRCLFLLTEVILSKIMGKLIGAELIDILGIHLTTQGQVWRNIT